MNVSLSRTAAASSYAKGVTGFYETWIKLTKAKKLDELSSLIHSDFVSSPPDGSKHGKKEFLDQAAEEYKRWEYRDIHFTLERVSVEEGHAVVYLTKRFVSVSTEPDRNPSHYVTTALAREALQGGGDEWHIIDSEGIKRDLLIDGAHPDIEEIRQISAMMQNCQNPDRP